MKKTTMLVVSTEIRDQAKVAAAIKRQKLNEFVESAILSAVKKVVKET